MTDDEVDLALETRRVELLGQRRARWRNHCHLAYDEVHLFVFISLTRPFCLAPSDVEEFLRRSRIASYCIYPVYGSCDLVVSCWGSKQRFEQLESALDASRQVRDITLFAQSYTRDLRNEEKRKLAPPRGLKQTYKKFRESESAAEKAILMRKFMQNQCIEFTPQIDAENAFRFFSRIDAGPDHEHTPAFSVSQLIEELRKVDEDVRFAEINVRTQEGPGTQTVILIDALTDQYHSYFGCLEKLAVHCEELGTHLETFVVASRQIVEEDAFDIHWNDYQDDEQALLRFLDHPDAFSSLGGLSQPERDKLLTVFKAYSGDLISTDFFSSFFESHFRDFLLAYLLKDMNALVASLTALNELEGYFAFTCQRVWMDTFEDAEDGWFNCVKKIGGEALSGVAKKEGKKHGAFEFDPKKTSMKHAAIVIKHHEKTSEKMSDLLGEGWFSKLESTSEIRNEFAHGRLFFDDKMRVNDAILYDGWEEMAKGFLDSGHLFNGLINFYQKWVESSKHRSQG